MDLDFPLEDDPDSPLDIEKLFTYPESLRTARVLVKLMMHKMEDKDAGPVPNPQPTITGSFPVSRPVSTSNPTMPNTLKEALTLNDMRHQNSGKVNGRAADLSGRSDGLERSESSHVKFTFPPSHAIHNTNHDMNTSLGDLYPTSRRTSDTDHNLTRHTYLQGAHLPVLAQRFPPTDGNTFPFALSGQSGQHAGTQPPRSEGHSDYSPYPVSSLSSIQQSSSSPLALLSNLASIDRDFLGFSTMAPTSKPAQPSSTSNAPQHVWASKPLLAPQPRKAPSFSMYPPTLLPKLASKPADDREMLQVVEGGGSRNSPFSDATRSGTNSVSGMKPSKKVVPRKRKLDAEGHPTKRQKTEKGASKGKGKGEKDLTKAKYQIDQAIWMRILEFCPVQFLGKARFINKEFKGIVDQFTSIYVNCRKENYGHDMPPPPAGLTERQYSNLLGSKGCLEPGCSDKHASRTHWSWAKRWCANCWKSKIEREDRLIKNRSDRFVIRNTLPRLLECIPVGMHDSFMKPHDYIEIDEERPRAAPRLYKYYLKEDVDRICDEYEALSPAVYVEDPTKTAQENATALQIFQDLLAALDEKRSVWMGKKKAEMDEHMAQVQKIEAGIRKRRETNRTPYDENRNARKELFTRRAREQLPHIDEDFVKSTAAFKAATRVFRDGGTERGWQTLKPKIEKEWEKSNGNAQNDTLHPDGAVDADEADVDGNGSVQVGGDLESMAPTSARQETLSQGPIQLRREAERHPGIRDLSGMQYTTPLLGTMQHQMPPQVGMGMSMGHHNVFRPQFSAAGMGGSMFAGSAPQSMTASGYHGGMPHPSFSTTNFQYTNLPPPANIMSMSASGDMNTSNRNTMSIHSLLSSSNSDPGNSY